MRERSVSIYAKNQEEYMESLNNLNKEKRLKKLIDDEDEYEGMSSFRMTNDLEDCEDLEVKQSYTIKVDTKTAEDEENELYHQLENINNLYKSIKRKEIRIKGKENKDLSVDDGLNLLCSYIKDNIRNSPSYRDPNLVIHQSNKKFPRSMSNNSIADISVKEILDSIVKFNRERENEDDNNILNTCNDGVNVDEIKSIREYKLKLRNKEKFDKLSPTCSCMGGINNNTNTISKDSKKNSILSSVSNFSCNSSNSNSSWSTQLSNELFVQNLECEEEVLKVMMIGSTHIGKTLLINNFLDTRRNKYEPSSGLEIKKKIVNILNKNVRIEFYDTDANFHLKDTSRIYYKLCDAFLYVVDWSKKESLDYITHIHQNILNNSTSNSFFLVNLNNQGNSKDKDLSKKCLIQEELKNFAEDLNVIHVPLVDVSNFHIKFCNIFNVFSYILVKKIKKKNKSKCKKKLSDLDENSHIEKMSYLEPCLGFNQSYKVEAYNNINNKISIDVKRVRNSNHDLITNV